MAASLCVVLVGMSLVALSWSAPAPLPAPEPAPGPAPDPSPIWRLFGGFGGYSNGFGQRGSRAYNGPPPEGPNEYKSICRVNNPDNYAFGPGRIPAGPVCPW